MKEYQKQIVWVDYFDSTISRGKGRRVPSHAATKSPALEELKFAAQRLGLEPSAQPGRRPSSIRQTGYVQVRKTMKKSELIRKLTEELARIRAEERRRQESSPKR